MLNLKQRLNWSLPIASLDECCPGCACETEILSDGKSTCENCGWKEVLPCSWCPTKDPYHNEYETCDWNEVTRCKYFPKDGDIL